VDDGLNAANIILIGMPGAGKSTIGVLLAKALGMAFIDTDLFLQASEGLLLQEIIDRSGVKAFLAAEERTLLYLGMEKAVIATGGSAVYGDKAMEHLKANGVAIYLHASLAELDKRLQNMTARGIAMPPGQDLAGLYRQRQPLYEKYADLTVDCDGKDIEGIVGEIAALVRTPCPTPSFLRAGG